MDLNVNTTKNFQDKGTAARMTGKAPSRPPVAVQEESNHLSNPAYDDWDIMVEFEMPRPPQGESAMMAVRINRYEAYLPRGKKITAPKPVYQLCMRKIKMERKHQALADELQGDFKIGER